MNRLTEPRFWLNLITMLICVVPAAYGWAWAFEHFAVSMALGYGVTLGLLVVTGSMLFASRNGFPERAWWRRQVRLFGLVVFATPALGVYLYLADSHPLVYAALLGFAVGRMAFTIAQATRRVIVRMRIELA